MEPSLPLGAAICAAVGRFPGQSPEEMLADITRHSRFTAEEFRVLATERPIDVPGLHRRIRSMIENSRALHQPHSERCGWGSFSGGERAVQPDLDALEKYQRHAGNPGRRVAVIAGDIKRHAGELQKAGWERQGAETVALHIGSFAQGHHTRKLVFRRPPAIFCTGYRQDLRGIFLSG